MASALAPPRASVSAAWGDVCAALPLAGTPDAAEADFAWAASGAMALTGEALGPPLLAPAPLAHAARGALERLRELAGDPRGLSLDAAALLGERAACFGFGRRGAEAAGARCRLLASADGWLAVHLAREDDLASLPAWLGCAPDAAAPWTEVARRVALRATDELVARARLLGMPVAPVDAPPTAPVDWCRGASVGASRGRPSPRRPRVVDLSSLWAGPLCTHLLQRAGADVVKVESRERPDGARRGDARFFSLLNHGKRSVALDFTRSEGRRALARLLAGADIVVESARPRALEQLGVDARQWLREGPGRTWVGITGYGRTAPQGEWIAFGDDAGAAAGLCAATGSPQRPLFCGDAIADPLTGMHAAVAALASFRAGGGYLSTLR